jgi:hypothetical protein
VIAQGDLRPMAENARAMDDLNAILASREPLYAKADLTLDTAGKTAAQSARELLGLLSAFPGRSAARSGALQTRGPGAKGMDPGSAAHRSASLHAAPHPGNAEGEAARPQALRASRD